MRICLCHMPEKKVIYRLMCEWKAIEVIALMHSWQKKNIAKRFHNIKFISIAWWCVPRREWNVIVCRRKRRETQKKNVESVWPQHKWNKINWLFAFNIFASKLHAKQNRIKSVRNETWKRNFSHVQISHIWIEFFMRFFGCFSSFSQSATNFLNLPKLFI